MTFPTSAGLGFVGKGLVHDGPWLRGDPPAPGDPLAHDDHPAWDDTVVTDPNARGHPARYEADDGLVAAVNTALLLNKPLLLTGSPGTGKSELAERLAWERQLGPLLRFEAQSVSEASDLFYRFDLVGRMAESRIRKLHAAMILDKGGRPDRLLPDDDPTHPVHFVELGCLGVAMLKAGARPARKDAYTQAVFEALRRKTLRHATALPARRSVVLIDEIDKASRDFPNDLLNGIERMEFCIRELDDLRLRAPDPALGLHPIVVITSNQERDLPPPFLRRCAFHHIEDPSPERLAHIVRLRLFPGQPPSGTLGLPKLYADLLGFFVTFRKEHEGKLAYSPGTTELLDFSLAMRDQGVPADAPLSTVRERVVRSFSAVAKHRDDAKALASCLDDWLARPA